MRLRRMAVGFPLVLACAGPRPSGRFSAEPGLQPGSDALSQAVSQRRRVLPGIDVLLTDSAHLIAGRRLGLITNQTGVDAAGVPSIDRLHALSDRGQQPAASGQRPAAGARLVALFAPEHGIRGTARPGERVNDTVDAATGLPIYSLYGANRAPTAQQLEGLDVLLVDLQDVGARTFTYVSTMVLAMRAAAAVGKRIIVLDRPNPIGCTMQGPVLDTAYSSFIGMLPVPLRHGMTMGELARFANAELRIGADLVVVPVKGWRCEWFDQTGLPWVRPSPNLPDLEAVAWYPGTVLFEATNLSVGRGTDAPFRQIGAPWLDVREYQSRLRAAGVAARFTTFTPRAPADGKFDGREVRGLELPARARTLDPVAVSLWMIVLMAEDDSFRIDTLGLRRRLGTAFESRGDPWCQARRCSGPRAYDWSRELAAFRGRARSHFLYRR